MMLNYWERFEGTATIPPARRLHVSLNWKGVIYLNANAYTLLGRPEAVALYFNRGDHMIGISSAPIRHTNAFPIRQNNNAWLINAMPFCRNYGIRVDNRGSIVFKTPDLDSEGILRLDLKTTTDAPRRPQGPRRKKTIKHE